jgi:type IX secretion system PorP/SprF family membrane protein
MRRIYLILVFAMCCSSAFAQQSPLMSHYMFNGLLLNPAYAGSKEYVSTTMMYRKQWAGMEGAPVTYSGTIHGLLKKKKLGLGMLLQQDKIGVTKQTDVYGMLAYHLPLGVGKLSVGLQGGVSNFSSEVVKLTYWDPGDKVFDYNTFSNLLPNAGLGAYYYRDLFYAGVSAPFLLSYDPNDNSSIEPGEPVHKQVRRYYVTAGGVIETERELKFKPSFLLRYEAGAKMQYDLNLNMLINEIFWLGTSYRSDEAIIVLFEYQISRKMRVGYSYDYTLGELGNYNSGSHEFMIGYDFGFPVTKMKSPRYF